MKLKHVPRETLRLVRGLTGSTLTRHLPIRHRADSHTLPGKLVVSLTSYPPRFPTLDLTLRCLLSQNMRPDALVLWIAKSDRAALPRRVERLTEHGLTIQTCQDWRSYKKIIPALDAYAGAFLVTADDDIAYSYRWLRDLVTNYRSQSEIPCVWARRMALDIDGSIAPVEEWRNLRPGKTRDVAHGALIFTGTGALYPPGSLHPDIMDVDRALTLCPHADDVWVSWMAARAGTRVRAIRRPTRIKQWPAVGMSGVGLYQNHNKDGGNDRQIAAMVNAFGLPWQPSAKEAAA